MEEYELFDKNTKSFIYGSQSRAAQRMLDFDYLSHREEPSVVGFITPSGGGYYKLFWGTREIRIPRFRSVKEATDKHPEADVMVNFASERSSADSTMEALECDTIRTVIMIAEGVPQRDTRKIAAYAKEKGKWVIGPATVGGLKPGCFKIGNAAGTIQNIRDTKLYRPGSVGFVSVSGGLSNEGYNIVSLNTDGIYEGYAVGGDVYPATTLLDHLLRYEKNPKIKMMVALGELGGRDEYEIVEAIKDGKLTKPLVMWVTGTCSKMLPGGVQFGHAGAKSDSEDTTAEAKNKALREAGVVVPDSFNDYGEKIKETFEKLKAEGKIEEREEPDIPNIPMDYKQAVAEGIVRKPTSFISTICDETGDVHNYCGVPIDRVIKEDYGIGGVLGLLWFKKDMPRYARDFLELVIQIVADHGPAVSGAHNTIVTARAGKSLIESIVSGIVTIGPRFGGAVNGAAKHFSWGMQNDLAPRDFINAMKEKNTRIQGIGHRIHSVDDPDVRVEIMVNFAREHFPKTPLLDYALDVQKVTTMKKNTLILNVDGCIGVLCVDLLKNLGYEDGEIKEMIDMGFFNALFIIGRTMGFMGHYFDQKRLKTGLYRHPWDDILYDVPDEPEKVE
ncbi:MAG TPA: citrate/2-methylcitrate synthase [Candidatus Krumholzibacteriaceae bacterium]|nr:citrate/2-methylcitrate synthase [Candidatus Krumholzibacteriaceae bacterium]